MKIRLVSVFSLLSIVLAGCGVPKGKGRDIPNLPPSETNVIESHSTPFPPVPTQEDDLPEMPKDPPLSIPRSRAPVVLIESAKMDLAQRLSVPISQIEAIETKEATWPDASLGCPEPGIVYAQVVTPGYLVMLEYAGNEYEYHVGIHGDIRYCENPIPPIS